MPPTSPSTAIQRIPSPPLQRRKLALFSRNYNLGDSQQTAALPTTTTTILNTQIDTYSPYWPPPSLHASLVAEATSEPTSPAPTNFPSATPPTHHNNSTATIAIAFSIGFVSLLCGLAIIILLPWFKFRNTRTGIFQRKFWFRRYSGSRRTPSTVEEEPVVLIGVDFTGGNTVVHDTTLDYDLKEISISSNSALFDGPPRIPPSIVSAESLTLRPDYSASSMIGFQQRLDAEEADISMAIGIAMRDCTYSGSELSTTSQVPKVSPVKGRRCDSWDLKYRTRQGSNASDSTEPTTESEVFSVSATLCSSLTSIPEIARDSDIEDFDLLEEVLELEINNTEDVVFEVARAQAQSMEIKRGVLVNWSSQRASLSPVLEEETLFLTQSPQKTSISSTRFSTSFPAVPSLVVTCPSMMTIPFIDPSFSSFSVDLDDFPLPPSAFDYDKPFDEIDMENLDSSTEESWNS